jgi:hypothetical protein
LVILIWLLKRFVFKAFILKYFLIDNNIFDMFFSWYEGICHKKPSQDNGLESSNNIIKTRHRLRKRLPLGHYLGIFYVFYYLQLITKTSYEAMR